MKYQVHSLSTIFPPVTNYFSTKVLNDFSFPVFRTSRCYWHGYALAMVLACTTVSATAWANSGGKEDIPFSGDYTGRYIASGTASADRANVTIDTIVNGNVYGAYNRGSGTVNDNQVTLSPGGKVDHVYGGYSKAGGNVFNNIVTVNGGTVTMESYGGYSNAGTVFNNAVIVNDGSVASITVAQTGSGAISGNAAIINGGIIINGINAAASVSGEVTGNRVIVNGGTVGGAIGGYSVSGAVSGNTVTVNAGTVEKGINAGDSDSGNVTGNAVIINGGTIDGDIHAGESTSGSVQGNTVVINGGTVNGHIAGGFSDEGNVTGNSITIKNARIMSDIIGGYVLDGRNNGTNNTISISGTSDISNANLYGGKTNGGTGNYRQGNTLNLDGFTGNSVKNIINFQTVNIQNALLTPGQVILKLKDGTENTNLTGTTINILSAGFLGGGAVMPVDRMFTLLENANAGDLTGASIGSTRFIKGVSLLYDAEVKLDATGNKLEAIIKGVRGVAPETRTFSTSRIAAVEFLNQGADFALGAGLDKAVSAVDAGKGFGVFGGVSGGETRSDVGGGHHAKASGTHFIVGAAGKVNQGKDKDIIAGAYVGAGWGDITDSHITRDAKGDTHYYGVGLIGKYRQNDGAAKGVYAQVNLQVGYIKTDYYSHLSDMAGNRAGYDKGSTYWGAGLGVGYQIDMNTNFNLDVYGQYKWLHLDSMDTNIVGDPYQFEAINSHRTKLGGRLNYTANKQFTPYIGLAWEHEFSGKSKGNVHRYELDEVSLKGSSGVGEVGVSFKPNQTSAWRFDANVQGYFGQREGVAGRFFVNYAF